MRFFQSFTVGLMTLMLVAFGMTTYLFQRATGLAGGAAGLEAYRMQMHAPVLYVPLALAFVLGFALGWWRTGPE